MNCRKRSDCRVCRSTQLREILSLGPTPLANAFIGDPVEFDRELSYPLDLYLCESCSLVQLLDVVDSEVLFRDYIYVSGTSDTVAAHNAEFARSMVEALGLGSGDLVIEIASNDGSLLSCFQGHGVPVLGVEPARNIAAIARGKGIETINEFFDSARAARIRESRGAAKLVVANNVLAHVDEPADFMTGCRELLDPEGLLVIEVPYLRDLLERLEYDTVYHEHLSYFSSTSLLRLCDATGFSLVRIAHLPIHGGSLRLFAAPREGASGHSQTALDLAEIERREGMTALPRYQKFAADVESSRRAILNLLEKCRSEGRTLAGYGAPAKGNTLLNYCRIGTEVLPFTVDKNPLKVGLYTPGMHIPVLPVSALLDRKPDLVLVLAWNFAEEIMAQQREYRELGGRFIVPIPEPVVV